MTWVLEHDACISRGSRLTFYVRLEEEMQMQLGRKYFNIVVSKL
jgi:hypothetical protein